MSVRTSIYRLFSIGFLASSLWACGQAGPLYLPQDADKQSNQEQQEQSNQQTPAGKGQLTGNDQSLNAVAAEPLIKEK